MDCSDAELLSDAEQIWKRLIDDIAGCRKQLLVENFIFSPGLAGDAITDAMVRAIPMATGRPKILSFIGAYHGGISGSANPVPAPPETDRDRL